MNIDQTVAGTPSFNDNFVGRKHFPITVKTQPISTRLSELTRTREVNISDDEDAPYFEERAFITRPDMVVTTNVTTCCYKHGNMRTFRLYGPQGIITPRPVKVSTPATLPGVPNV